MEINKVYIEGSIEVENIEIEADKAEEIEGFIKAEDIEGLREWLNMHPDDINKVYYPLHQVANESDNVEIFSILLEYGADIYKRDIEGETCLHIAASAGHKNIVKRILSEFDDDSHKQKYINIKNNIGFTSLMKASMNGNDEIVILLLEHGANIFDKDRFINETCLHHASREGHLSTVAILLNASGCQDIINANNFFGNTCLCNAYDYGFPEIVILLLQNGADPFTLSRSISKSRNKLYGKDKYNCKIFIDCYNTLRRQLYCYTRNNGFSISNKRLVFPYI